MMWCGTLCTENTRDTETSVSELCMNQTRGSLMSTSGHLMTLEMLLILAAESFCLTSRPWWRLSMSQPRERSTRVEVRACHHLDMIVVEEDEEETGGETMADLGHQSRDTSNLGMTGTDE